MEFVKIKNVLIIALGTTFMSGMAMEPDSIAQKVEVSVNGTSFNMVKVEGGTFFMGSVPSKQESYKFNRALAAKEKGVHEVTLSDYYIGEMEVTQELWVAVMGDESKNPSWHKGAQLPVHQVSWVDCHRFILRLNAITGKKFRMPTEAEWEFAARGGLYSKGYTYSGSNGIDNVGWSNHNSKNVPHKVGLKVANELGIYDRSGNVWEWCQDWYDSYGKKPETNPTGPEKGTERVYRGGAFNTNSDVANRVTYRRSLNPKESSQNIGLRLACSEL